MRAAIVLIVWILLGIFYWWSSKSNCCGSASTEVTTEVSSPETTSSSTNTLTSENAATLQTVGFVKSSSDIRSGISTDKLINDLKEKLAAGESVTLSGIAFEDEENPRQLAIRRAEAITKRLGDSVSKVKLRSELINEPYREDAIFIVYQSEPEVKPVSDKQAEGGARILEEEKTSYLYIDRDFSKVAVPDDFKLHFRKIAKRLDGNFCKVVLNAFTDDKGKGGRWVHEANELLIRYGVIPNRISSSVSKQGNRESEIMEIIILE